MHRNALAMIYIHDWFWFIDRIRTKWVISWYQWAAVVLFRVKCKIKIKNNVKEEVRAEKNRTDLKASKQAKLIHLIFEAQNLIYLNFLIKNSYVFIGSIIINILLLVY